MTSAGTILLLHPDAPRRPPAWRWQLAGHARTARERREPTPATDPYTDIAGALQDIIGDHTLSESGRAYAMRNLGPVADAYAFWDAGKISAAIRDDKAEDGRFYGPLSENALALSELEGLLLTGKPPEVAAKHTGLSLDAIKWFERLWFDVRTRLRHPGWIATNVIGSLHQGSVATLLPALIRAYGYYSRSPRIVKTATAAFDATAARNAVKSNPDRFFVNDAVSSGGLKAALAIRLMPLTNQKVFGQIIELHQETLRVTADTAPIGNEDQAKYREVFGKLAAKVNYRFDRGEGGPKVPLRLSEGAPDEDVG